MASELNIRQIRALIGTAVAVAILLVFPTGGRAQVTYEVLRAFTSGGSNPLGPVIQAGDGNFYGTTSSGGATGGGTVFKLTPLGVLTTLHSFDCSTEGCAPTAGLVQASDGNLYGATTSGGPSNGGSVFKVSLAGAFTVLRFLDCSKEGCAPRNGFVQGSDGKLYGTAGQGGPGGAGSVFKITTAGVLTTMRSFNCNTAACGPLAGLVQASDGNFYGTMEGGAAGGGTVFKITPGGALTTLHSFDCGGNDCLPRATLIQASDGNLYGTTEGGGAAGGGTVFRISLAGVFTALHSFDCNTEGCFPQAGVIQVSDGIFYGTTSFGGATGGGTVFKIASAGDVTVTTLHSFDCSTEGCQPFAPLVRALDTNFYGTTTYGGLQSRGAVFKMTAEGAVTTVSAFHCSVDGCRPAGGLIQVSGDFYGTTESGGATEGGTVFKITSTGDLTTLHSLNCDTDGCGPAAGVIRVSGNFYGTTEFGGAAGGGTVFQMTPEGVLSTLHSFDCTTDGCDLIAGLIYGSDGNFYGTTSDIGPAHYVYAIPRGTVFRMTPGGELTTLHTFDCNTESCFPQAGVIQVGDGVFYGTTTFGPLGGLGGGSVFKITVAGDDVTVTTLHSFLPDAGLIQVGGAFYGVTRNGGAHGGGTVFKMTVAGDDVTVTTLHSFDCDTDGCLPTADLIQASDGNLYGTTEGQERCGPTACARIGSTIFRITLEGVLTTLHIFDCSTQGCQPRGRLVEGSAGKFYGTAVNGGPGGAGTVFRLTVGGPGQTLSALSPAKLWVGLKNSDAVGLKVDLLAEVLTDAVKVGGGQLNNVSAGSTGFNNALLDTIPLVLTGGPVGIGSALQIRVSVRRTCTGPGHLSGTVRLWYDGRLVDTGASRDAGSRFDATIGDGPATNYFLRTGLALSETPGTSKQSIDVAVDSMEPCPDRTFKPFGTWSIVVP